MKVKIISILNMEDRSAEGHALKKRVPRMACLFLALCLLIGCASEKVEERVVKTFANTVTTDEILPDSEGEDILANSHFTYDIEYMDPDKEEEAGKENLLLQKSDDGVVTAKVGFGKLALLSSAGEYVDILAVTDDELICIDEEDKKFETGALYCIPLSYKDGKEEIQYEKKEVVWKGDIENVEGITFYACAGDFLVLEDYEDGCVEHNRRTHERKVIAKKGKEKYGYYSDNRNAFYRTGDYILCSRYVNHREQGVYCHKVGTENMKRVTECGLEDMIVATGEGCFYYTGLSQQNKGSRYDVWLYDCEKKQNRRLLTGEQIENLLPEPPAAGGDFIREMKVVGDRLYIEVRYAGDSHVLSYEGDSGKLQVENHMKELIRHKTYKIDKALTDANRKYSCCNDRNMYLSKGGGLIEERGLDGAYIRTIHTRGATLLSVNNEELILQYQRDGFSGRSEVYSVPIVQLDGSDYPDVNRKRKLTELPNEETIEGDDFYADSEFLVFISNCHIFYVFDRKKGDYIELQNDPSSNHYFDNFAMSDNYMENCFVFNTKPFGKNDDKYGFSCYKRGENKVIRIEKNFYTQSYICDDRRKQIIYEREDFTKENSESEFFSYASGGKKKRLFTSGDLGKILRENGVMPEEYFFYPDWAINGSRLYLVSSTVVSYDLEDKKIRFEKELTEQMKEEKAELVSFCGIAEGRFFIRKVKLDEEEEEIDETERIYCYDLAKKSGKMLSENNPEYLYYLLV